MDTLKAGLARFSNGDLGLVFFNQTQVAVFYIGPAGIRDRDPAADDVMGRDGSVVMPVTVIPVQVRKQEI